MSSFRARRAAIGVALLIGGLALSSRAGDKSLPASPPKHGKSDQELAQLYAGVAEWRGVWTATETEDVESGEAVSFALHKSFQSNGEFVLKPLLDSWSPEHGDFTWVGEGTVRARNSLVRSRWYKTNPTGSTEDYAASGTLPTEGARFAISLDRDYVSITAGWANLRLQGAMSGVAVNQLGESEHYRYERKTFEPDSNEAETPLYPLKELYLRGGPPPLRGRGPGVFTFSDQDLRDGFNYTSHLVLYPVYDDVECRVEIDGYDEWLPRGNIAAPTSPGSGINVRATLVPKSGKASPAPPVQYFRFELEEVSREPGIAMNWPQIHGANNTSNPLGSDHGFKSPASAPQDPNPDLSFAVLAEASGTDAGLHSEQQPVKDQAGRDSALLRVNCFDFGGHATLRVVCVLEDGREIMGILEHAGGPLAAIPLPYRQYGSHVAAAWAEKNHVTSADGDDSDEEPVGDGNRGDGFSNYEEYRGFVQAGDHLRTKPGRKDLFVLNRVGAKALPGFFQFMDITGLALHYELREAEMPVSRRMNTNRSGSSPRSTSEYQCGLILNLMGGTAYSIANMEGKLWRPKYASSVSILSILLNAGVEQELSATIAHEMLHAIGARHHGQSDEGTVEWRRVTNPVSLTQRYVEFRLGADGNVDPTDPGLTIRIFRMDATEVLPAQAPRYIEQPAQLWVGTHGGQHSGFVDCVMRYDCARAVILPGRPGDRFYSGIEPTGMGLCTAGVGTDFNAPGTPPAGQSRFGNADRGDCAHQFCVRDDGPALNP